METAKDKGIDKWGPISLSLLYLFSWICLVSGFLAAFYYLLEEQYFVSFVILLSAITSWASLNAFVYLAKVIIEIRGNTAWQRGKM